jgi:outer membrane protein insertion porin family
MSPVFGTLFADYASDLDSGETVIGDPAGARGKPGRWVRVCPSVQ